MVAGLAAVALIGFAGLNPHLPGGGDNAEYIAQAEALNQLGRRANLHLVGDPEDTFRPPLYPWLLSFVARIVGRDVVAFKAINVVFALGAVAAAWWFLMAALRPHQKGEDAEGKDATRDAGWVALWFALTPLLIYCAHDVLSDVPFTCLALLALGCAARGEQPRGGWWLAGTFVLLVLAMLMRTAAVLMAGALAGYFVIGWLFRAKRENTKRLAMIALTCCLFTGGLLFWSSRGTQTYLGEGQLKRSVDAAASVKEADSGSLGATVGEVAERVRWLSFCYGVGLSGEVAAHDVDWPYFALPPLPMGLVAHLGKWSHWPRLVLVGLAAGWGCVVLFRRRSYMIPVVFLLHLGALLIWPFFDARFFLPILPLFLALVWVGARDIVLGAMRRGMAGGLASVAVLAVLPMVCLLGALSALGDIQPAFLTTLEWAASCVLLAGLLVWLAARSKKDELGGRLVKLLAVLVLSVAFVRSMDHNLVRERQWGPALPVAGWSEFHAAAKLIEEYAEEGDVIVSAKTSLVWFWTDLKGIPVPATTDPVVGSAAIEQAQWAVVDSLPDDRAAMRFLWPLLKSDREHWKLFRHLASRDERGEPTGRTAIFKRIDKSETPDVERKQEP